MKKLCSTLLMAAVLGVHAYADPRPIVAPGFVYEDIYTGHGMTAIDFDPTGGMLVCEKMGRVLLFEPKGKDFNDPVVILDLSSTVNADNESGLLGIAVDPQFSTNHFVYIFYTTDTDQQLARYKLNDARTLLTDPVIFLKDLPRKNTNHKAGDIHFSPKDPNALYVILGNDAVPDSAQLVNDLTVYNGKLLRLNKADGKGLPDNPFYDGNPDSVKSRVWAMGFRNPFRFTFPPSGLPADTLFISENGDGTDRQAMVKKGGDGGWSHGGDNGLKNPPAPTKVLITQKPSLTGVSIAETGPFAVQGSAVYYYAKWYDVPGGFGPVIYRGTLNDAKDTFTPIPTDPNGMFAIHLKCVNLKFGPDGALYTTNTFFGPKRGDSPGNGFALGRIRYTGAPALPGQVIPMAAAPIPKPAPQQQQQPAPQQPQQQLAPAANAQPTLPPLKLPPSNLAPRAAQ